MESIAPHNILPNNLPSLKKEAKLYLKEKIQNSSDAKIKLSEAQAIVAKKYGFKDWYHVISVSKSNQSRLNTKNDNRISFIEEVKGIKKQFVESYVDERTKSIEKEKLDFQNRVEAILNNLNEIKTGIKEEASKGNNSYKVMSNIKFDNPISLSKMFGSGTETTGYDILDKNIITSEPEPRGIGGRWYFVDNNVGKSAIKDEKLLVLWETLEDLELQPYFELFGLIDMSLNVHF